MRNRLGILASIAAVAIAAVPVAAQQQSQSYKFLEAVKKRKGDEVTNLLSVPGGILINTREVGSGESALHIVTRGRDSNWIAFLLSKNARPDIQNKNGDSPLAIAAQLGWTEGAEALLSRRASVDLPNSRGETPLIVAVQKRDLPMVRLLLAHGANPKRTDNVAGYSAIDYAKQDSRAAPILQMLEATGAKPVREMAGPKL